MPLLTAPRRVSAEDLEGKATLSMSMRWIDRAHIEVYDLNLNVTDQSILSEEAQGVYNGPGPSALNAYLKKNGGIYVDGDLLDVSPRYTRESSVCEGFVNEDSWSFDIPDLRYNTGNNTAQYWLANLALDAFKCYDNYFAKGVLPNSDVNRQNKDVQISDEQNRDIWFRLTDDNTMERVDTGEKFTRQDVNDPNKYTGPSIGGCFQTVNVDQSSRKSSDLLVLANFTTCEDEGDIPNVRIKRDNQETGQNDTVTLPSQAASVSSCEENNTAALSWLLCGFIDVTDGAVESLGDAAVSLLDVNQQVYSDSNLKLVWSYFKNIATFLLIIVGLVMIVGQAVGRE